MSVNVIHMFINLELITCPSLCSMFAYWAQLGYIVAAIHHCDGSSSKVPRPHLNDHLLYEHPDMQNYDKDFRPRQGLFNMHNCSAQLDFPKCFVLCTVVSHRQKELHEMKEYMLKESPFHDVIDSSQIVAAGFSYGAATASLEVVRNPHDYKGCILLDGWFHIEVGDGFNFPQESHEKGTCWIWVRCYSFPYPHAAIPCIST